MEVTPEGITIDSLETTVVGSNQANDLIRESLNGPPTEFLQSLMQMASHIMTRNAQGPPTTASATTAATTEGQAASQQAGQNTQARGNSQTQPTTATHTRSTARPHVHLAQQAVQAGFDPFLPCNSHHISRRRQQPQSQQAQQRQSAEPAQQSTTASSTTTRNTSQETPTPPQPPPSSQRPTATGNFQSQNMMSFMSGIFESIRAQHASNVQAAAAAPGAATMGDGPTNAGQGFPLLATLLQGLDQGSARGQGLSALEQLLQTFQLDQYVTGENIITELPILFIRNLTLMDLFTLCRGNIEPLNRNTAEVQNFVRTRWCNGDTTPEGINSAVDRLIAEFQRFLEYFNTLPVRNDIDLVRSSERVLRQRLPTIIKLALRLTVGGNLQLLLQQLLSTVKTLLALALHASANGQQGVEQILEQIVTSIIHPQLPQDFQNLTLMTSRVQLRQLFASLDIPDNVLQQYIVRRSDPSTADTNQTDSGRGSTQEVEAMDLDEPEATGSTYSSPTSEILEDAEPLPNVIIGSEPWHAQVPEDWVPIITRDAQKQRRQNPQGPFSDGYLSGMPSKRRKIVNSAKPQGSLPQVITESVRQAVSSTGLTAAAPLETVAQLAGASPEIQTAYRNLLRSTVQANLRDNADFLPERFPNAAAYFDVDH
nr:unnamed protein product [Callosobruchus chinensis]